MKPIRLTAIALASAFAMTAFTSCLDDDDSHSVRYPNVLVTVKNGDAGSIYLQLDDKTTLRPANVAKSPFGGKEVRALANVSDSDADPAGCTRSVTVNWIDSILTKPAVNVAGIDDLDKYGNDPVEIVRDWTTVAEDGYLTLRFRTNWTGTRAHYVNLLYGADPEKPYEVEFRHNAFGDLTGRPGDALVAFNLRDLPDTKGDTVMVKITWNSFVGHKSASFPYCTGCAVGSGNLQPDGNRFVESQQLR